MGTYYYIYCTKYPFNQDLSRFIPLLLNLKHFYYCVLKTQLICTFISRTNYHIL